MRNFRSSGTSTHLALYLAVLLIFAYTGGAQAEGAGTMILDIHDGAPCAQNVDTSDIFASGNFMTGIDTWGYGFRVDRMWFYHGGNYADSGEPYQVHFIRRVQYSSGVEYVMQEYFDRETTCNYCWESFDVGFNVWQDGSDEESTFGVFVRPFGGLSASPAPMLWRDCQSDHEQSSAIFRVYFPPPPGPAGGAQERDTYGLLYYFSDWNAGEVLLGMEITSDGIVSTEAGSFSTIKSLY